jgi:hypothetical protein
MENKISETDIGAYIDTVKHRFVQDIELEAKGRRSDVKRGAETPRLSALMLAKYGKGLAQGIALMYGSPSATNEIQSLTDKLVSEIDPAWKEHDQQRWQSRPADLLFDEN